MTDLLYLTVVGISLLATLGLVKLCDHLSGEKTGERP